MPFGLGFPAKSVILEPEKQMPKSLWMHAYTNIYIYTQYVGIMYEVTVLCYDIDAVSQRALG